MTLEEKAAVHKEILLENARDSLLYWKQKIRKYQELSKKDESWLRLLDFAFIQHAHWASTIKYLER